jgi:hypothetical protein
LKHDETGAQGANLAVAKHARITTGLKLHESPEVVELLLVAATCPDLTGLKQLLVPPEPVDTSVAAACPDDDGIETSRTLYAPLGPGGVAATCPG